LQGLYPDSIAAIVAHRALDRTLSTELRVLAIRALADAEAPAARDALLELTEGGRSLLGGERLPSKTPELIAALTALATGWSETPAVRRILARAAASKDPEIRAATAPRVDDR
jgi:hypothetical protein